VCEGFEGPLSACEGERLERVWFRLDTTESTGATAAERSAIDREREWNVELGRRMTRTWARLDEYLGGDEIEGLGLSATI
jgi:hypothetical protein